MGGGRLQGGGGVIYLDRRKRERVVLLTPAGKIVIEVCRMGAQKVSLGIIAGPDVSITRPDGIKSFDPETRIDR